jgi:hypothetical protein
MWLLLLPRAELILCSFAPLQVFQHFSSKAYLPMNCCEGPPMSSCCLLETPVYFGSLLAIAMTSSMLGAEIPDVTV